MLLLVKTRRGMLVNKVLCDESQFTIGRSAESSLRLNGWKVSTEHAFLYRKDEGYFIKDGGSRSGTTLNGKRIAEAGPLQRGHTLEIGDYIIEVESVNSASSNDGDPAESTLHVVQEAPASIPLKSAVEAIEDDDRTQGYRDLEREWKRKVHRQLIDAIDLRRINVNDLDDESLRRMTGDLIGEVLDRLDDFPSDQISREDIARQVIEEAVGLGPIEGLLARDDVSEVMVNAYDEIYFECRGKIQKSPITFMDNNAVMSAIERIVAPLGRRIDESSPMVDARLKDGSRVNAIIPPLAIKGPSITIRKFMKEKLAAEHLIGFGSASSEMVKFLELAVTRKLNVIISGGTGSGKTTLLNILSNFIPSDERILTIEDAAELKLNQPHIVSLEARPANQEGKGSVSIRDLVKNSLRMRPDRIVVGECRGGEALDMLQAMNTGHDGSLTTVHSNSPRDCISRLEVLVLMSGMELPVIAIREQISSAVNLIVQQTRYACGSRKVSCISEVTGIEGGIVQLAEIFRFKQSGYDEQGRVEGRFVATGIIPEFCEHMRARGVDIDLSMFDAHVA